VIQSPSYGLKSIFEPALNVNISVPISSSLIARQIFRERSFVQVGMRATVSHALPITSRLGILKRPSPHLAAQQVKVDFCRL
jgi:hypothetical protein